MLSLLQHKAPTCPSHTVLIRYTTNLESGLLVRRCVWHRHSYPLRRQPQVAQQLEDAAAIPNIGAAGAQLLVDVEHERMPGCHECLARRAGDVVVVEGALHDAHQGRIEGGLFESRHSHRHVQCAKLLGEDVAYAGLER